MPTATRSRPKYDDFLSVSPTVTPTNKQPNTQVFRVPIAFTPAAGTATCTMLGI